MTALVWDQTEDRRYEAGVSRGVFYPIEEAGPGYGKVWNGLVSVVENHVGIEEVSSYRDGVKYLDTVKAGYFQAVVSAFATPAGFAEFLGEKSLRPGVRLAQQPRKRFNFTYRTEFGSGYKIHLVYNVIATPTTRSYATQSNSTTPSVLAWNFDATPVAPVGFRPSAHLIIDSTQASEADMIWYENYLYGTEEDEPEMPTLESMFV